MINKIVFGLIVGMFLITLASASDPFFGTFKNGQDINITQTCNDGTNQCDSCNLTVRNQEGSDFILNVPMTKRMTDFNYTLSGKYTIYNNGIYKITTLCSASGVIDSITYEMEINTTGKSGTNLLPIILLIAGFLLLFLGIFQKAPIVGFASGILLSIAGIFIIIYGLNLFQDLYTQAIAYVSLFLGLIICFASAYEQMSET